MANNRMYLRCRTCGDCFFLGKCFLDGYYTRNIYYDGESHPIIDDPMPNGKPDAFLDAYNQFLDEHTYCCKEPEINEYFEPKFKPPEKGVDTENQFEIAYEFWNENDEGENETKK